MNFALIGAAGYIAPRHMQAIKETGHRLVVALDKSDSVGVLDRFFPDASFFTEFERFDRHIEKLRRGPAEQKVHMVSICSPNYLHDAHIRFALRVHADAICEKPIVLEPWNVDALMELEGEYQKRIWTILQLRLHPAIADLRRAIAASATVHDVDLTYVTSRGRWYLQSWKGDEQKSGGVAMNIGIHFFDMLMWIFGAPKQSTVHLMERTKAAGYLELERARVRWFLSVDSSDLPPVAVQNAKATYRALILDGKEFEFSEGFTDLHRRSYEEILAGRGSGLADVRPSIHLVHDIRNASKARLVGDYHPMAARGGGMSEYFKHESAYVDEGAVIGQGTKIWHFSHIMKGARIGERCVFGQNVNVDGGVIIGDNVKVQNNVSVYTGTTIEDDVFLGPSCVLTNVTNPRSQINRHNLYEKTRIRRGATVGANATVVCGVTLGRYSFIAAGSVVTKDVPDYALVMGNPARQRGWMSRHGHLLKNPDKAGIMVCPESGLRYQLARSELRPLTSVSSLRCLDLDEEASLPDSLRMGTKTYDEFKSQIA